jgi:hypothetical protein
VRADLFASILATGACDAGDVRKNVKVMEKAYETGKEAVK